MGKTEISWTDMSWNPVRGCSRVSEGCRHCYAEQQAARIVRMAKGRPSPYDGLVKLTAAGEPRWTGEVRLVPEHLADPLRWKKPRRVFVNSMSDLFHESLTNEQIAAVFGVMAAAPQHTFQILTKRARRMREWFEWAGRLTLDDLEAEAKLQAGEDRDYVAVRGHTWPLPNVWLGISVENQEAADERIPELLRTPAAVRFLSCEPLLGPVDLCHVQHRGRQGERISWVISGCESGPGARPCEVEWLRSLRDQCAAAGVPYFLKQAVEESGLEFDDICDECGERERWYVHGPTHASVWCGCTSEGPEDANWHPKVGAGDGSKRKAGGVIELPYLDGVQHCSFPEVRNGS